MKVFVTTICGLFLLLTSCSSSEDGASKTAANIVLPASNSKVDEIYLFLDDTYKPTPFRDSLLARFNQPYLLTSRPSSRFNMVEKSISSFTNGANKGATNVFVVNTQESGDMMDFATSVVNSADLEGALAKEEDMVLLRAHNYQAKPQDLYFLLVKKYPQLTDRKGQALLGAIVQRIADKAVETDNSRILASISTNRNTTLEALAKDKFGIEMWVPSDYDLVDETDNFAWFIKETRDLYSSVVLYKNDSIGNNFNAKEDVYKLRDELGRKITVLEAPNTRMTTQNKMKPFPIQRELTINDKIVYETRGLWEMANYDMGGAFINYTWKNTNGELITIDGFTQYGQDDERRKMRDLDAILSSVKLN